MRNQPKAKRTSKKALVPPKGDFYDVSEDATVEIQELLKKRILTVTYACGASPLPPCLPPPPGTILSTKKKKVYVVHDSTKKELTLMVDVSFETIE